MSLQDLYSVAQRLSLRAPQKESLEKLFNAIKTAPDLLAHAHEGRDLETLLAQLKPLFPELSDFEREFPSLCFALATGVGKTRLMGAFISYLHKAHGIRHFFVLAPNLTIYNKLIQDFTPGTPKYVFKGISEFATAAPILITGDNYDQQAQSLQGDMFSNVVVNVFNISKINSEVRGGKSPRIKRLSEYLGQSYFEYLAGLDDLVLLMDESHRYRACAGVKAINELQPLLGLELTATPFVEATGGKQVPFKNVVMNYPLGRAIDDGFVKTPAVVTQRNFNASQYTPDQLEFIKLEDGVRLHEATKVELQTYANQTGSKYVKPFILVIAKDTTHAAALLSRIESNDFHDGNYKGKVIQVDSSKSGKDEEEMINRLLAVESVSEATEIVIHVNMLKEGWDVTNLYTIVPLRAANARTLVEQSIGRGLRLPYGKRTGVEAVDRLSIVAHDRFQEIVDDSNKVDSPIRLKTYFIDPVGEEMEKKISVTVRSTVTSLLGLDNDATAGSNAPSSELGHANVSDQNPVIKPVEPTFKTPQQKEIAKQTLEAIKRLESQPQKAPTSKALLTDEVQKDIVAAVAQSIQPPQSDMLDESISKDEVAAIVAKATQIIVEHSVDIPRIIVQPKGDVSFGFKPFKLDLDWLHLQPGNREIVGQDLHSNKQFTIASELSMQEQRLEDYIVYALMDFDDVDYDSQADLLYDLAGQVITHLQSYLDTEQKVLNVLDSYRRQIADNVHQQMTAHAWSEEAEYEAKVSRGFTQLKPSSYTVIPDGVRSFRETVEDVSKIKQMLFGGFEKCLYPVQKFDSDTERRFAVLLERDAIRWFKPAQGQFQIYYQRSNDQPEYIPDFVAELEDVLLIAETKARKDISADEVLAKAKAAKTWCVHASSYSVAHGGKPWKYALIPHDEVLESRQVHGWVF